MLITDPNFLIPQDNLQLYSIFKDDIKPFIDHETLVWYAEIQA